MQRRAADGQLSLFRERPDSTDFEIRESRRARRLSIRIFPHGRVEVVVPWRTRPAEVSRFVDGNRRWIEKTLRAMTRAGASADLGLPDAITFAAVGESWCIDHKMAPSPKIRPEPGSAGGRVELSSPSREDCRGRKLLRDWVAEQGRRALLPELAAMAGEHGFEYQCAGVGRQKTRWGSCSASGRIRLNCSLLFLPARLARYVMLHELCHLRVLNHSARFWSLLECLQPGARELDREMNAAWAHVPGWLFYEV